MSLIKTKELFDEFFTNYHSEAAKTNRTMVDRPEVYAYEEKIGKQLVDMSVDELLEMLRTFHDTQRKNTNFMIGTVECAAGKRLSILHKVQNL